MAAENDFPLETIIIIVVVIVVLFIAIFFGSRFINTRLQKRNVFKKPGNVKNETGGRGEYRYTDGGGPPYGGGGGASKTDGLPVLSQPLMPMIKYSDFIKHEIDIQKRINIIKAQLYYINNSMHSGFGKDASGNNTGSQTGSDIRFKNFKKLFKHLNLKQEQCDNIRQNIISDIFEKDIPLTTITINAKDPADKTKTIQKDINVPDDNEYIRLSILLINEFERLSIKINLNDLYNETYVYINATIDTFFKKMLEQKSSNHKQEVAKLINKSKKLTDVYLISPLLMSEYIDIGNKQVLLLKHLLWQCISIYDPKNKTTQINPNIAALFTSSAKTLDNLFEDAKDIDIISKHIKDNIITGHWDKMFDYLKILNDNNMNILALLNYIGYNCKADIYTTEISKEVEKHRAYLDNKQTQNNKNITSIFNDKTTVLNPKKIVEKLFNTVIFKSMLQLFVDVVQPLNKIVEFTGSKKNLADHKSKLDKLKKASLNKIKEAYTKESDNQILNDINTFANKKYKEYIDLLNQLTNATALYKELKDFVVKNDPKTNYDNANQLYLDGIQSKKKKVVNLNELKQNLKDFKQYVEIQLEYNKITNDLNQIYSVLPNAEKQTIKSKIDQAESYYGKFYELLDKIHQITVKYHGKYGKIMKELIDSLTNSNPIYKTIIDNSDNMQHIHTFASITSKASLDLAQTLGIHNITDSKDPKHTLNTSINEKHTEITDNNPKIGKIMTDITSNLGDIISKATEYVKSETETLNTDIKEDIDEKKDNILKYINASILADTVPQADALNNIDIANQQIIDLQKKINTLNRIDPNMFTDIIDAAGHIKPTIAVVDLESAIKTNNDTYADAKKIATDCTVAIYDGAIKIATDTYDDCNTQTNALPTTLDVNTIINYITGLISIDQLYVKIVKYIEIAAKINDTTTEYKDILKNKNELQSKLEKLYKKVEKYISKIFDLSATVTTASDELKSINSVTTAEIAIDTIEQIKLDNANLFALFNQILNIKDNIFNNINKLQKPMIDNIAQVDDILNKSIQAKHDAEIEETKSATAAATAAAAAAAAATAAAAAAAAAVAKKAAEDAADDAARKLAAATAAINDKYKAASYKLAIPAMSDVFDVKAAKYNADISDYLMSIAAMKTKNTDIITNATILGTNLKTLVNSVLDITINTPDIGNMKIKQTETENAITAAILDTHTNNITKSDDELKLAVNGDGTNPGYLALLQLNVKLIKDEYVLLNSAAYLVMADSIYNPAIDAGLAQIKANEDNLDKLYKDAVSELDTIMKPANDAITTSNDAFVAACDSFIKTKEFVVAASKKISGMITNINTDIEDTVNKYDLTPVDRIKGEIDAIVLTIPVDAAIAYANGTAIKTESDTYITADLRNELNFVKDTVNKEHLKSSNNARAVNLATISVTSVDPISKLSDLITALDTVIAIYNNIINTINPIAQIQLVKDKISKLELLKDIAKLMKKIGYKYVDTNTLKLETDGIAAQVLAAKNDVDAVAIQSADAVAISDNLEQDIVGKIGNISDRNIASELNSIRTKIAEIKRIDDEIRNPITATNPVPKAHAANLVATASVATANTELDKFNNVANNYENNLVTWLGFSTTMPPKYGAEKAAAKVAVAANVVNATDAKNDADRANTDAANASNEATTKYNRIAPKIQLIRTKIIRIEQLIDDINNESDDDTKEQSSTQQQDDDKVKPFSQNSYDILPLDPKVATLSSNMQFSESKSTATNNPGNSFMYTIVPYDSQELSSDDRVLEIVSFARTQRMPIKDATNIIAKAEELLKKYRGTKKVIPGAWVYRGGKLFSSVKPTKIEELERYIELMRRSLMR